MTGPGQLPLLPDDPERWGGTPAPATPIVTSGRTEYSVRCAGCGHLHRHTGPGTRRAPCGTTYTIPAGDEDPGL
ncbi:hypothetical protein [Streptomyces sp. bgisy153]|uniref:hypothetical protein n=1 Tax=Streptomyces sp. bgisy153 TaxID=3413793 RepID=UPI003D732790